MVAARQSKLDSVKYVCSSDWQTDFIICQKLVPRVMCNAKWRQERRPWPSPTFYMIMDHSIEDEEAGPG